MKMTVSPNYHIFIHRISVISVQAADAPVFNTYPGNYQQLKFSGTFLNYGACFK